MHNQNILKSLRVNFSYLHSFSVEVWYKMQLLIDYSVQDYGNSIANALGILKSCTKLLMMFFSKELCAQRVIVNAAHSDPLIQYQDIVYISCWEFGAKLLQWTYNTFVLSSSISLSAVKWSFHSEIWATCMDFLPGKWQYPTMCFYKDLCA